MTSQRTLARHQTRVGSCRPHPRAAIPAHPIYPISRTPSKRPESQLTADGPGLYTIVDRERFIRQRVGQLTTELCSLPWAEDQDGAEQFRSFSRLISALYHYEFHDREQVVTEAWKRVVDDPETAALVTAELTGLLDGSVDC